MKEHIDRDEFSELISCAFDNIVPGESVKDRIFNNIIEECESSKRKRTSMETIFMVRRVCMICAAVMIFVVLSGGVFTSVNSIMKDNKNQVTPATQTSEKSNDYRAELVDILRGNNTKYDFINGGCDEKLADAFEKSNSEYVEKKTENYKFTFLGTVSGNDIDSTQDDKTLERTYAAVRVENLGTDVDMNYYQYSINEASIIKDDYGKFIMSNMTPLNLNLRAENGHNVYMVIDMTDDRENYDKDPSICICTSGISGDYGAADDDKDDYPFIYDESEGNTYYNDKTNMEHAVFPVKLKAPVKTSVKLSDEEDKLKIKVDPFDEGDNEDYAEKYSSRKYSSFEINHDNEIETEGVKVTSDNQKPLFDNFRTWKLGDNIYRVFNSFKQYNISGDGIKDITYTLNQGIFCELVQADEEEESHYEEDGYITSMRSDTSNTLEHGYYINSKDDYSTDKPYTLLKACGKSITIPYDEQDTTKYGIIYIFDCSALENISGYSSGDLMNNFELANYIGDTVINISTNKTDGETADARIDAFVKFPSSSSDIFTEYDNVFEGGIRKN